MHNTRHNNSGGFTIVELLIVIVVIAILAAITIVAFNGIQNRAKNTQVTTAVRGYVNAIRAYATDNSGAVPSGNGCLGSADFYTDNPCYIGSNTFTYNASINSALSPYMNSSPPSVPTGRIANGSISASGIFYYGAGSYIGFPQYGTNSCPSITGLSESTTTGHVQWGSNMYCRLAFP